MEKENICTLCGIKQADRKNSHIVSLFIVASMLSKEGKARDNEITASITTGNFAKSYVGRNINQEKIEELFGRDFTEQDVKNNTNDFSVDYILCGDCETKLGRIESYVAEKIYIPFKNLPVEKVYNQYYKTLNADQMLILKLFFITVLWRASITRFGTFRLSRSLESRFKQLLNDTLSLNESDMLQRIRDKKSEILQLPFYIFCQENTNDGSTKTNNVVSFNPFSRHPYYAAINEFVLCFYTNNKATKRKKEHFLGFEKFFYRRLLLNPHTKDRIKIIGSEQWNTWREGILKSFSNAQYQFIRKQFIELFVATQGFYPNHNLVLRFMDYIIFNSSGILDKYQATGMVKAVQEFFDILNEEISMNNQSY